MLRHGIPADMVTALRAVSASFRAWGSAVEVTRPLRDGDELELRERTLRVLHRPGHSPSDTVFHDEARAILIAGDHLIAHISSNPLRHAAARCAAATTRGPRPQALVAYIDSLEETRAMDDRARACRTRRRRSPTTPRVIDARMRLHARRAEQIFG